MKKWLVDVYQLLRYSWRNLFWFEAIYQILRSFVFVPLLLQCLNLVMRLQGFYYLTTDNLLSFARRPFTMVVLIVMVFVMLVLSMWEIVTVIYIIDAGHHKKNVSLIEIEKMTFHKLPEMFTRSQIWLAFLVLLLMPLLHIGFSAGIVQNIQIPGFIQEYIYSNTLYTVLFVSVMVFLLWLLLNWIFCFQYFVLEDDALINARKESARLSENHKILIILAILVVPVVLAILAVLLIVLLLVGIATIREGLSDHAYVISVLTAGIALAGLALVAVVSMLSYPLGFVLLSSLYYQWDDVQPEIAYKEKSTSKRKSLWTRTAKMVLLLLMVGGSAFLVYELYYGNLTLPVQGFSQVEVTAHRGASSEKPENTMYAFEEAVNLGADWIELDVQQSKDGQIFVCHDSNLKRITGVDANAWELDYSEIRELDAGSFLDASYSDAYMPLLDEVIQYAKKNNIKLNIELKPTGNETDYEQKVIDLIKENNFMFDCVVSSLQYDCLSRVKEIDSNIQTVYVGALAYGNILQMNDADGFSLEEQNVTESVVSKIHNAGKQLFVWTVNDEDSVEELIDLGVDNIITDDVQMVKDVIAEEKNFQERIHNYFLNFSIKTQEGSTTED